MRWSFRWTLSASYRNFISSLFNSSSLPGLRMPCNCHWTRILVQEGFIYDTQPTHLTNESF